MRREIKFGVGIGALAVVGIGVWFARPHKDMTATDRPADNSANSTVAVNDTAPPAVTEAPRPSGSDRFLPLNTPPAPTVHTGSPMSPSPTDIRTTSTPPSIVHPRAHEDQPADDAVADGPADSNSMDEPPADSPSEEPIGSGNRTDIRADAASTPPSIVVTTPPQPTITPTPVATGTTSQPAGSSQAKLHVVQAGETFSSIATKYLGNAKYAGLIAKANPDRDPRRLNIGMKIKIPAAPATTAGTTVASPPPAAITTPKPLAATPAVPHRVAPREVLQPVPADRAYTVKGGEGWEELAKRYLGNSQRWPELYELNKERVTRNPHRLRAGTVIELPTATAPAAATGR